MSLLDSLTLAYETLADDPIEVSIQYGKSILKAVNPIQKISEEKHQRALITPSARRVQREMIAIDRNSYADYTRRPMLPAQRNLVGVI